MASYTCPKSGCESNDPDWCSECGADMHPSRGPVPAEAAPMLCPACGTPRENNGRFCGVCRYNFETGQPYSSSASSSASAAARAEATEVLAVAPPPQPPAPPAGQTSSGTVVSPPEPAAVLVGAAAPTTPWAILIVFDPTVDPTATPDISVARPRLTFPLDLPELLIGRAGGKNHPEIPVEDEGVSSRHAKIVFSAEGRPFLLELGSTNGTRVNGVAATAGLPLPLNSGDQIVLGRWTRMTIKAA
jgi:hypothetical protein